MKYVRTKDGITTSDKVTHQLIEHICCAGYLRTLEKGANVRIGKQWTNFYGHWVDIIDENGCHYSIRPNEVERVTKELPQADTIKELIDEYVAKKDYSRPFVIKKFEIYSNLQFGFTIYGSIWTDKGLIYVAKMNDKGELELL